MKVTYKEYNKSMQMVPVHTIKQRICLSSELRNIFRITVQGQNQPVKATVGRLKPDCPAQCERW